MVARFETCTSVQIREIFTWMRLKRETQKNKKSLISILAILNLKHLWDDSQMFGILYTNVSGAQNMDWERSYDRLTVPEI